MKYLKPILRKEIERLWGQEIALTIPERDKPLFLVVKKDGTPHKGGGRFIAEYKVKPDDVIIINGMSFKAELP